MLSVIINVKNGQKHLRKCLDALKVFEEVILLDNFSVDMTIDIASSYKNVRIHTNEFIGMGKVRNLAASLAYNDWVFFVDCDEVISSDLANTLKNYNFCLGNIYSIKRYNYFDRYHLESSSWKDDWVIRIYNRTQTSYLETEVHESVNIKNLSTVSIKTGMIYHFPYDSVYGLIDKMQLYSTLYATQFHRKKNIWLYFLPFRAFFMFIKCYIIKKGFLDGYEGLIVSIYNSIGVFSKYIKLYELYYKREIILAICLTQIVSDDLDRICGWINKQKLLPSCVLFIMDDLPVGGIKILEEMCNCRLIVEQNFLLTIGKNVENSIKQYVNETKDLKFSNVVLLNKIASLEDTRLLVNIKKQLLRGRQCKLAKVISSSDSKS